MENICFVWLNRIDGIGAKKQSALLQYFKSAYAVFNSSQKELKESGVLNDQQIHKILSVQNNKLLENYRAELEKLNMRFIPCSSEEYPALLKSICEPPIGIYIVGELPDQPMVSIIGSRKCSEYGLNTAYRLSKELARSGVTVVSGMARGADSMAHRGAIEGGGLTVAVLGSGVNVCYPPENRSLMKLISENGCIISEYPPGTKPSAGHFPARNRIISGISMGTVVVEAGQHSGTLITVDQALEEGREVMAVPGNITSKLSYGTNNLIRQGAMPVTSSDDILEQLGIDKCAPEPENNITLAPLEKLVYDCIGLEPVSIEGIYGKIKYPDTEITYVLTILEIRNIIRRLPGQRVVKV